MKIVIAHSGLDRKITKEECLNTLGFQISEIEFIDFEISNSNLSELYELPFENLALTQQRIFTDKIFLWIYRITNPFNNPLMFLAISFFNVVFH